MRHCAIKGLLLLSLYAPAWADQAPTIQSATGASGFTAANNGSAAVVYGGLAGSTASCTQDGINLCSNCSAAQMSCATNPLCSCNTSRIYDSLTVQVNVSGTSSTGTPSSNVLAYNPANNNTTAMMPLINVGPGSFRVRWLDICKNLPTAVASCESVNGSGNVLTLNVFFDSNGNNIPDSGEQVSAVQFMVLSPGSGSYDVYGTASTEGIGGFTPYPGDSKIFIENPQSANNFPNFTYGGTALSVRVYVSNQGVDKAAPDTAISTQDLAVTQGGSTLANNVVDSLSNGTLYFFRIAEVDQAGNVVQFYPGNDALPASCLSTSPSSDCPYSATPDQVLGILDKTGCFIATAAYGSSMEPKIGVLRAFRHVYLLPNKWGLKAVALYYKYGPYAARFIADKPILRSVVRGLLWPAYGFSYLALKFGIATALACVFICLFALVSIPLSCRRYFRAP